ncbi:glycosyltransferase family 2 protein [Paludibacteraceae bacterium OttesenSCG-928-F17]|nr:glycosyltransferase family 2 protein [Paludibacteraceae bacterium OttesenSCG-928-F17]
MKTSIVILNYNGADCLQKFIPILMEKTVLEETEIIVADNGSTDNSLETLIHFPSIRVIKLDKNYGFAEGYNKALAEVKSDYYVLLNSDIEVTDNWLEPLVGFLESNPEYAACQPKIRSYRNRNYFEHAGAAGGFIDKYGFPFCRGRIFADIEEDNGQYDTNLDVFWATGACMLVRGNLFHETGGLDGGFFAHMEEIDLCWRLRNRGYKLACVPESKIYHVGGATLDYKNPFKVYLNFRNSLLMLYKNLSAKDIRKIMFIRYFFDYVAAFQMLLKGEWKNFKMVVKARRDYKKMRPDYIVKRKENLSKTTVDFIPEILQKSLVVEYFLKGKKTYNSLMKEK